MSFDAWASGVPEIGAQARRIMLHAFRKQESSSCTASVPCEIVAIRAVERGTGLVLFRDRDNLLFGIALTIHIEISSSQKY
jgi:hypothetical protein